MATEKEFCELAIENAASTLAIKFPQYPSFGGKFKAICHEEAYEEIDVLIDDVAAGFDESVILESIFEDESMKIESDDREPLCTTIHYSLSKFSPPPTSLNLVDMSMKVSKKELESMREQVRKQAICLKPDNAKDDTLLKCLIIGRKNHFPLLVYLVDTYSRFRLREYRKLYDQLNRTDSHKKRRKFIGNRFRNVAELPDFFKKSYAMHKLQEKKKKADSNAEKALLWYESSVKSFFRRLYGAIKITPQQMIYKINDNMKMYAQYYLSILVTVNNILRSASAKLPLQIDFWIIPRAIKEYQMHEDDDDDDEDCDEDDDDDDEKDEKMDDDQHNEIGNLDVKLNSKNISNLCVMNITNKELARTFFKVYEKVVKGERNKRMVIIVDRRVNCGSNKKKNYGLNSEEKKEGDKLYGFLPNASCQIPAGSYLHESLFNLSRSEVIPSTNGTISPNEGHNAIHASSEMPNMCLLSIQIHEESVVRAYWYINGGATRFYVHDMANIWPLYFIEKSIDEKTGKINMQDRQPIIELINAKQKHLPLKEANFDAFFQQNTNIKPSWI